VARRKPKTFSLGMGQRLGLAAALLGDPHTLILDEPANGLDPHGIQWLREFLRAYAVAGRTVFVSSHLLAEMALTAAELVVIGRGRLIAQCSTDVFVDGASRSTVRVTSPQVLRLAEVLIRHRIDVEASPDERDALVVTGVDPARVGELAAAAGVVVHALSVHRASLEEAFMRITGHDVEFVAGGPAPSPEDVPAPAATRS
jgi:ABC-2 type transport system ATP-binding protein